MKRHLISLFTLTSLLHTACGGKDGDSPAKLTPTEQTQNTPPPPDEKDARGDQQPGMKGPVAVDSGLGQSKDLLNMLSSKYCLAQPKRDFEAEGSSFSSKQKYFVSSFGGTFLLLRSPSGEWLEISVDEEDIESNCNPFDSTAVLLEATEIYSSSQRNSNPVCTLAAGLEFRSGFEKEYTNTNLGSIEFPELARLCKGLTRGYTRVDPAIFSLSHIKSTNSPMPVTPTPVIPTPVIPTPVIPTPVIPTPVIPTPVIPTPAVPTPAVPTPAVPTPSNTSSCNGHYLERYQEAYSFGQSYSGMNLDTNAAKKFAELATKNTCRSSHWLPTFKEAYNFGNAYSGMNLSRDKAYAFAIVAADATFASPEWLSIAKDAYSYANAYSGMNRSASQAYDFALLAANASATHANWLKVAKEAYSYANAYSGINLGAAQSYDFALLAAQKSSTHAEWLSSFKKAFTYAQSFSGLNMSNKDAYDFAIKAADQN